MRLGGDLAAFVRNVKFVVVGRGRVPSWRSEPKCKKTRNQKKHLPLLNLDEEIVLDSLLVGEDATEKDGARGIVRQDSDGELSGSALVREGVVPNVHGVTSVSSASVVRGSDEPSPRVGHVSSLK